ncbi:MAG: glutamine--fructose-6-phosphate transaminase (isomerizing) [Pseudomonadota bacterium]
MCGITGYIGKKNAIPLLLEGLHQLEYRGYDSAGIAIAKPSGIQFHKTQGKVSVLENSLPNRLKGAPGIGHTRWATHGEPSDANAHPHLDSTGRIAVVHNGIIENAAILRQRLTEAGVTFQSETDTEVLAHLIAQMDADNLEESVRMALREITGTYGLAVIDSNQPDRIVVARNGSPVIIGIGDKEMFVASDTVALVRYVQQVVYLDDGEVAVVTQSGYEVSTLDAQPAAKTPAEVSWSAQTYEKGDYTHYMLKEIEEQPESLERTLKGRLDNRFFTAHLGGLNLEPKAFLGIRRIKMLGCGSAYIAGLMGARMIERLARIPCDAEPASEFRYRNPVIEQDTLYIAVSQSGETFDTLAAVQEIQRKGGQVLGIINVVGSTIARTCGGGIYLHAGPEIAVVSTKTFVSTLIAFALLALYVGRIRDLSPAQGRELVEALEQLSGQVQTMLDEQHTQLRTLAEKYAQFDNTYFIGRNDGYPIAMEGALKLKEVSYIHAEAYPASELKHGPLALITPDTPTIALLPDDDLHEKNLSSIEEIRARRGPVLAITQGQDMTVEVEDVFAVPRSHPILGPIFMTIALQVFAYHAALVRACNVDQPRNLAKSVTVE